MRFIAFTNCGNRSQNKQHVTDRETIQTNFSWAKTLYNNTATTCKFFMFKRIVTMSFKLHISCQRFPICQQINVLWETMA